MNRDLSLDILRGLMLIIMASDHFGEPIFQHLYEFPGYVSAAEGFVFLSGMLVSLVYGRYYTANGFALEKRVWHRAGVIYLYHLIVLLAVFAFSMATELSGAYWKSFATEMQTEPARALLSGIALTYQAPMLDVLPMYVAFMLVAPLALRWMMQYRTVGVAMVLSGSLGLWVASQYGVGRAVVELLPDTLLLRSGAFDWFAWQLVFVLGMVLGFLRAESKGTAPRVNGWLFVLSVGAIAYLYMQRHGQIHAEWSPLFAWLMEYPHIHRDYMGWLRLLNFLAFVYAAAMLIHWHKRFGIFTWLTLPGRWLAFLGQHSLQVFAFHMVVLYCYIPFRWGDWALSDTQKWFAWGLFMASLSIPAWWHARYLMAKKVARTVPTSRIPALQYAPSGT